MKCNKILILNFICILQKKVLASKEYVNLSLKLLLNLMQEFQIFFTLIYKVDIHVIHLSRHDIIISCLHLHCICGDRFLIWRLPMIFHKKIFYLEIVLEYFSSIKCL